MLENWLKEHPEAFMNFNQDAGTSVFRELALYQDYHGLAAFKKVISKNCKANDDFIFWVQKYMWVLLFLAFVLIFDRCNCRLLPISWSY